VLDFAGTRREEPGTSAQGAPVFPGSSRLGIEPKTPRWLVQDRTPSPSGDLEPTQGGAGTVRNPPVCCLLFITAVPNTKLCAWGEEDSGGHVLVL
jgi:hypothetical protein